MSININGINISEEHGHHLLEKNGVTMTCDHGELNETLEEFETYYQEAIRQLRLA
jgi:hypothetical protein